MAEGRQYGTQTRRPKWNETSRNCQIGDIVLLRDETTSRNQWPLQRVTNVYPSNDGLVRKVQLLVTHGDTRRIFEKPVHKLILIYVSDEIETKTVGTTPTRRHILK